MDTLAGQQLPDEEDTPHGHDKSRINSILTSLRISSRTSACPVDVGEQTEQEKGDFDSVPVQTATALDLPPEELRELLRLIPGDAEGNLTSIGSIGHVNIVTDPSCKRVCTACPYFSTPLGCVNGFLCSYCHIPHVRKNRYKPCKGKRDRAKRRLIPDASEVPLPGGMISSTEHGPLAPTTNL